MLTKAHGAVGLVASFVVLAAALEMSACSKTEAEPEPEPEPEEASVPVVEAGASDTAVTPAKKFCEGSTAPICDDFGTGVSNKWMRRTSGSGTLSVETTEITSAPSAMRAKITASQGAPEPAFALIEQQVALPDTTTYVYLNARVQTVTAFADQGGVRVLRVDSRGLPAILVIAEDTAFLATQDLMGITQLGKTFPWTPKIWHAVSLQFTRTPGVGATIQLFVDGNLATEGQIATFDSPYSVQIGAYRETSSFGADLIYDDVTLLAR